MKRLSVVAAAVLLSGCGYALAGRGNSLPANVKRIGVPTFENHSATPDLDRVLTEAIRAEFQSKGRFLVVQESTGVDAVLTGTVKPLLMTVAAFTDARQARSYLITVNASVEFTLTDGKKVFWSNPNMRVTDEYEVTGTIVNDPSALFSSDANALNRIARAFARSLVQAILEAF